MYGAIAQEVKAYGNYISYTTIGEVPVHASQSHSK